MNQHWQHLLHRAGNKTLNGHQAKGQLATSITERLASGYIFHFFIKMKRTNHRCVAGMGREQCGQCGSSHLGDSPPLGLALSSLWSGQREAQDTKSVLLHPAGHHLHLFLRYPEPHGLCDLDDPMGKKYPMEYSLYRPSQVCWWGLRRTGTAGFLAKASGTSKGAMGSHPSTPPPMSSRQDPHQRIHLMSKSTH